MHYAPISAHNRLVLASQSPRRKKLLEQMRIPFEAVPSRVHEHAEADNSIRLAKKLAIDKAIDVWPGSGGRWVLGADTIVEIDEIVLGKPNDEAHARQMLQTLSGKTHRVLTGFSLLTPEGALAHVEVVATDVKIKELSQDEIKRYIQTGEPFGKAGSYAIQGIGAFMVESITGSYTNVVGLPVYAVIKALLDSGALEGYPIVSSPT